MSQERLYGLLADAEPSFKVVCLCFRMPQADFGRKCKTLQCRQQSGLGIVTVIDAFFDNPPGDNAAFRIFLDSIDERFGEQYVRIGRKKLLAVFAERHVLKVLLDTIDRHALSNGLRQFREAITDLLFPVTVFCRKLQLRSSLQHIGPRIADFGAAEFNQHIASFDLIAGIDADIRNNTGCRRSNFDVSPIIVFQSARDVILRTQHSRNDFCQLYASGFEFFRRQLHRFRITGRCDIFSRLRRLINTEGFCSKKILASTVDGDRCNNKNNRNNQYT